LYYYRHQHESLYTRLFNKCEEEWQKETESEPEVTDDPHVLTESHAPARQGNEGKRTDDPQVLARQGKEIVAPGTDDQGNESVALAHQGKESDAPARQGNEGKRTDDPQVLARQGKESVAPGGGKNSNPPVIVSDSDSEFIEIEDEEDEPTGPGTYMMTSALPATTGPLQESRIDDAHGADNDMPDPGLARRLKLLSTACPFDHRGMLDIRVDNHDLRFDRRLNAFQVGKLFNFVQGTHRVSLATSEEGAELMKASFKRTKKRNKFNTAPLSKSLNLSQCTPKSCYRT
jgi:hypothetical protein